MSKNSKKSKNAKGKNKKNDPFPELGGGGASSSREVPPQWGNSPSLQSGSIEDGISRMNIQGDNQLFLEILSSNYQFTCLTDNQNPWNTVGAPKKPMESSAKFTPSSASSVATQPNTSNKNLGAKPKAPKSAMASAPSTSKAGGAIPKAPVTSSKAPTPVQGASITVPSLGRTKSTRTGDEF